MSKKDYESDATVFLNQFKKEHPEVEQKQLEGRARLWDKEVDVEQQEQFKAARVYQKPYVYQTNK